MKERNTIQKKLILDAVGELYHPTAEEVYAFIARRHASISRGTVYRNLGMLAGQNKLLRVCIPGDADHYDTTLHSHYHIQCKVCGKVSDVDLPYEANWADKIINSNGYLIQEHLIVLRGICPDCLTPQNLTWVKGGKPSDKSNIKNGGCEK